MSLIPSYEMDLPIGLCSKDFPCFSLHTFISED